MAEKKEYEITDIKEWPKMTPLHGLQNYKYITFVVAGNPHELELPSEGFTSEKAHEAVAKAAKEIINSMKKP